MRFANYNALKKFIMALKTHFAGGPKLPNYGPDTHQWQNAKIMTKATTRNKCQCANNTEKQHEAQNQK